MREFGLVGKSLKHSFSERYFSEKFTTEGICDCKYSLFELSDISEIRQLFADHANLEGVNVTIPYKQSVIAHLDTLSPLAQEVGAVNCIKKEGGKLVGYNTDIVGFNLSLEQFLDDARVERALILGGGGAANAVAHALKNMGIATTIVSRKMSACAISYNELDEEVIRRSKLIVNTTPLGTYPDTDEMPNIPYEHLNAEHLLFDLIYNPPMTKFLQMGAERGARCCNGYKMLTIQAEESWRIWSNK